MATSRRTLLIAATLATAVALAGCGSVGDAVAERAIEEGLEQASIGDVEVDLDDGGGVSVESSEGSFQIGDDAEVPDGFPDDVPLPDGDVMVAMSFDDDSGTGYNVTLESPQDVVAVADLIESGLADSGYELTGTGEMANGDDLTRTVQFEDEEWAGNIVVSGSPDGTVVSYNVAAAG